MANVQFELELVTRQWRQAVTQARAFFARETRTMARDAGSIDEAFNTLNVRPLRDIRGESAKLRTAFRNLRSSGVASSRDIARAQRALKARMRELRVETGGLSGAFARMGGRVRALIAVGGAAAIARITTNALSSADAIGKTADRVGLTTDALQELRVAADLTGVAQNALDMGMQRFSRRLGEAAQGSGVLKDTLAEQGIALRNNDGSLRTNEEVLRDYANAIQNADSDQQRLLLAFKAFDSEGAALVNTLKDGADGLDALRQTARDAGLVLDERLVRTAEEVTDKWTIASKQIQTQINTGILTAIDGLNDALSDPSAQASIAVLASGVTSLGAVVLRVVPYVTVAFSALSTVIKISASLYAQAGASLAAFLRLLKTRDLTAFRAEMSNISDEFSKVREEALLNAETLGSLSRARERDVQAIGEQADAAAEGSRVATEAIEEEVAAAREAAEARVQAEKEAQSAIKTLREQAAQGFGSDSGGAEAGAVGAATSETRAQVAAYDELNAIIAEIDRAKAAGDAEALQGAQARAQAVAEEVRQLEDQAAAKDVLTRLEQQYVRAATEAADALEAQAAAVPEPEPLKPTVELDEFETQVAKAIGLIDAIPAEKTVKVNIVDAREALSPSAVSTSTRVPGFASGGFVRGPGGIDNVFARLTRGESVIPVASTRANIDIVRALIRAKGRLPGFQVGGVVGESVSRARMASEAGSPAASPTPSGTPINIHLPGGQSFGMSAAPDVARDLAAAVEQLSRKHGRRAASA